MTTFFRKFVLALICVMAAATVAFAQSDDQDDIVTAAKNARAAKVVKARIVVSDQDSTPATSPFPDLDLSDPKGAEAILKSVQEYKEGHTAEQTETAARSWFEQNRDRIESLLSQVKTLTDQEREASEKKGEPVPDVVKQSDTLQQRLRQVLDALKPSEKTGDTPALKLPQDVP